MSKEEEEEASHFAVPMTTPAAAFADLPIGLVWQIAEYLPVKDVNAWKSTCSHWNRTLRIDRFIHPCSGCQKPTNTPFCSAGRHGGSIRCFFCRQPVTTVASFANDIVADLQFPECAHCHGERRVCPGCDKFLVGADPSSHYKACFLIHPSSSWASPSGNRRYRQLRQWKDRWSHLQALPCQQSDQQQNNDGLSQHREEKTTRSSTTTTTTTTGLAPSSCEKDTAAMEQNDVDATTATTTTTKTTCAQLSSEKRKEQEYDESQWAADFDDMVLIRKVHESYRKEK
jgi:hypothetical protein